jgi:hypothetical protein
MRPGSGKKGERPVRARIAVVWMLLVGLASPALAAPRVELLVMGPGDGFYERYGHAALRVIGPGDQDRVFNFGITSFDRPNYMQDFLGGRVKFWGNVKTWDYTINRYRKEDRTLWRLPLALTDAQVDALVAKLEWAVQPENSAYVYDTFRDNCATRIRDYLDLVTNGAVKAAVGAVATGRSFHDDVRVAFANLPHLLLPLELVPGVEMDAPRTLWEMSYHPETLGRAMRQVTVTVDGVARPLAGDPITEYERKAPDPLTWWPHWGEALLLVLAAGVGLAGWRLGRMPSRRRGAYLLVWAVPGALFGTLLVFVHCWSDWPDMRNNWLWAGFFAGDLWLAWPAIRLWRGAEAGGDAAASYLKVRLALAAAVTALGPFVPMLHGNLPPRLLALAGVYLCLRCVAPAAEGVANGRERAAADRSAA